MSYVYQLVTTGDRRLVCRMRFKCRREARTRLREFKEYTSTFRVVAENVAALPSDDPADATDADTDNIGSPIEATDANGDTVTYTLSGADASLFRIRSDGQLEVKGKLDHETDSSHTVTVTANDGSGGSNATASITVTIYVTDVDEAPKIMVGSLAISGMSSIRLRRERHGMPVATYTASGPDAAVRYDGRCPETMPVTSESAELACSPSGVRPTTRCRPTPTRTTPIWSP